MASNVSSVYVSVIDDVVSKVRDDFISSGAGDAVLSELQALWETKMMQSGVISGSFEQQHVVQRPVGPDPPVRDQNVPYEEYETPTAEMLFPLTPLQTPVQTPMPQTPMHGAVDYNISTGPSDFASLNDIDIKAGRPSPYMQPPSPWMNHRPLGVDVNVAYDEGGDDLIRGASHQPLTQDFFMTSSGKRKRDDYTSLAAGAYLPQQDGSGDIAIEFFLPKVNEDQNSGGKDRDISVTGANSSEEANTAPVFPQQDGIHDEYDNMFHYGGVPTEDYNAVNTPADHAELQAATPPIGTPKATKVEVADDDEPPLNEDDDDDEDLDEFEREEELQTQHLILAQFDKVSRTKARWKCTLKDGILHLNNRDILFNKATGEFDF